MRALVCAVLIVPMAFGAKLPRKAPDPSARIPLADLGYSPIASRLLLSGSSNLTLHYVDDTHLLITFYVHRLMKRLAEDPPDDADRTVAAVLLELPSGAILARTEWRLHDESQYLWPLNHGRFLLRIQNQLSILSPLANLGTEDAFKTRLFYRSKRRLAAVLISPEADLLVLETKAPPKPVDPDAPTDAQALAALGKTVAPQNLDAISVTDPRAVQVRIYRQQHGKEEAGDDYKFAGAAYTSSLIDLIGNSTGLMSMLRESSHTFDFDFEPFGGKKMELSPFDTSCTPQPFLVTRGEFVALGCRTAPTDLMLGGFNMRGENRWLQGLPVGLGQPFLVTSPGSGRLAIGIISPEIPANPQSLDTPPPPQTVDIHILQAQDGRELLRLQGSPVQKSGQTFALAPGGMSAAVIHNGNLEVHLLPPLSEEDKKEMRADAGAAPAETQAEVHIRLRLPGSTASDVTADLPEDEDIHQEKPAQAAAPPSAKPVDATSAPSPEAPPAPAPAAVNAIATPVDASSPPSLQPDAPRTPPTLYAPGEKPENPGKPNKPN